MFTESKPIEWALIATCAAGVGLLLGHLIDEGFAAYDALYRAEVHDSIYNITKTLPDGTTKVIETMPNLHWPKFHASLMGGTPDALTLVGLLILGLSLCRNPKDARVTA